ncbi:MAG: alpha,alpha-trehalase [Kofleriaceae bacterium]|nr:alpha,alpha-trehalase [Kofleriaceae bacterium]
MARLGLTATTLAALAACGGPHRAPGPAAGAAATCDAAATRAYVRASWATLTRSNASLLGTALDGADRASMYVAADADVDAIRAELVAELGAARAARVELTPLPADPAALVPLVPLYLPHPYVVPGGRFQEMYGWDSFFILQGLLVDGEVDLARGMTDNFLYEVEHYGMVLNANDSVFLTRSQPPLLSGMVRAIFDATGDRAWLARALPIVERYHAHWLGADHAAGDGLARYFDHGAGPAPEVVADVEPGGTHYDRVRAWYRAHPDQAPAAAYDAATDTLTPRFYQADRAMRESGFDPTDRFGRFAADILDYAPVCLNSLLFAMERDLGDLHAALGDADEADAWHARAEARRARVRATMWDDARGLFMDYRFTDDTRSSYPFVTTFFPLWVGLADDAEARRVAGNLELFLRAGGLSTSTTASGSQWDEPFGWAPMQVVAVDGLRRYGLDADADRAATAFLGTVTRDFCAHGTIVEKYDVVHRTSRLAELAFGYTTNEIGFGWTNAAYAVLLAGLGDGGAAVVDAAATATAPDDAPAATEAAAPAAAPAAAD